MRIEVSPVRCKRTGFIFLQMDKDIAFGFRLLLAFVVYGLANLWGQVGRFLPPVVIDLPVVFLAGIWLLTRKDSLLPNSLPLLLFVVYVGIIGWFDNIIRLFISASFDVEIPLSESTPQFWKVVALCCLLSSVALFAWQQRAYLHSRSCGKSIQIKLVLFAMSQLIWPVLMQFDLRFVAFHIFSWLVTLSLMFGISNILTPEYERGLRFLVVYWLLISFDLLQWISLELLM